MLWMSRKKQFVSKWWDSYSEVNYPTVSPATGTGCLSICTISFTNLRLTITEVVRTPSGEINPSQAKETRICLSSKLNHKQSTPIMIPLQIISSFTCEALPESKERAWWDELLSPQDLWRTQTDWNAFHYPPPRLPSPFPVPWPPVCTVCLFSVSALLRQIDKPLNDYYHPALAFKDTDNFSTFGNWFVIEVLTMQRDN